MKSLAAALVILIAIAGTGVNALAATEPDINKSLSVAAVPWGVTLSRDQVIASPLVAAISSNALAVADVDGQQIWLAPDWRQWDDDFLCTVIVHEAGHLHGQQHSADPDNVMFPYITRIYWRCERAFYPPARLRRMYKRDGSPTPDAWR